MSDSESEGEQHAPPNRYSSRKQQYRKPPKQYKFHPQDESNQPMTFDTVLEHVVLEITNKFENAIDFADALHNLEDIDPTLLHLSPTKTTINQDDVLTEDERNTDIEALSAVEKNAFKNKIETRVKGKQDSYDEVYKYEVEAFAKSKHKLPRTLSRVAAYILQYHCTEQMKNKLEQQANWKLLLKEPIALLQAIKILMHDSTQATKNVVTMHTCLDPPWLLVTALIWTITRDSPLQNKMNMQLSFYRSGVPISY